MSFEPLTPDRRRAMTRRHLLEAAAIVFARDGFHGATLDAIASYAGFTKGAVYSNFKSKDDLFLALLEDRYESGSASLREFLAATETPHVAADFIGRITAELDDTSSQFWGPLYLELLLYAMRNPSAR